jgi:hypothetical protein
MTEWLQEDYKNRNTQTKKRKLNPEQVSIRHISLSFFFVLCGFGCSESHPFLPFVMFDIKLKQRFAGTTRIPSEN